MTNVIYSTDTVATNESQVQQENLDKVVDASKRLLYKCSTVFPMTLFPDTVVVDQNKVDIVYSNFFFSKSVFTIMVDDIRTVKVNAGPFFATMMFEVIGYERNPEPVRFLPKRSAFEVRRLIMGLIAARKERVNLEKIDPRIVKKKVLEIGAEQEQLTGI